MIDAVKKMTNERNKRKSRILWNLNFHEIYTYI